MGVKRGRRLAPGDPQCRKAAPTINRSEKGASMTELLGLKDAELEAYYQDLFEMYGIKGWARIMADMEIMKRRYDRVGDVETRDELWFRKGQLDIIEQLLMHQGMSEQSYKLAMEQDHGVADDVTGGKATVVS
jgi:hypothetical protein